MNTQEYYLDQLERGIIGRSRSLFYFKKLMLSMYRGFPNSRVAEKAVKSIIVTDEDLDLLCEGKFLLREPADGGYQYGLGPNALSLISAWKTERLTENLQKLTKILIAFGAFTILLMILQLFFAI